MNEQTTTTETVSDKKDRKKKAIAFAKELGKVFSMNAAVGAGAGVGVMAGVMLVIRLAGPKVNVGVTKTTIDETETD